MLNLREGSQIWESGRPKAVEGSIIKWGDVPERAWGVCPVTEKGNGSARTRVTQGHLAARGALDVGLPSVSGKQELFLKSIPSPVAHSELECLELGFLDGPRGDKAHMCTAFDPHDWNELTCIQHLNCAWFMGTREVLTSVVMFTQ